MMSRRGDTEFILPLSSVSLLLGESVFVHQQFRVFLPCEVLLVMLFTLFTILISPIMVPPGAAGLLGCLPLVSRATPGVVCVCWSLISPFEARSSILNFLTVHLDGWPTTWYTRTPDSASCLCLASICCFFSCWRCEGVRSCEILTLLKKRDIFFASDHVTASMIFFICIVGIGNCSPCHHFG